MKILKNIRILSFILIFILCFFKIKNFYSKIYFADKYFVICDSIFSDQLGIKIKEFINNKLIKLMPEEFCRILKQNFPSINNIKLQKKDLSLSIATIDSDLPLYKINEDYIFTQTQKIFPKSFFNEYNTNDLEAIKINEDISNLSDDLRLFLNKIPCQISQDYKIIWKNKNFIELKDKTQNFTIIVGNNLPDLKIFQKCQKLKNDFVQNNNYKANQEIIADVRFADQIIFSVVKGG